jgi:hypothetical protein
MVPRFVAVNRRDSRTRQCGVMQTSTARRYSFQFLLRSSQADCRAHVHSAWHVSRHDSQRDEAPAMHPSRVRHSSTCNTYMIIFLINNWKLHVF